MRYKNTVTGEIIDVDASISGGNWQEEIPADLPNEVEAEDEVEAEGEVEAEDEQKPKKGRKKK